MAEHPRPVAQMGSHHNAVAAAEAAAAAAAAAASSANSHQLVDVAPVDSKPLLDVAHLQAHNDNPHSPSSHPSSAATVATPVHLTAGGSTSVSTASLTTPVTTPISGQAVTIPSVANTNITTTTTANSNSTSSTANNGDIPPPHHDSSQNELHHGHISSSPPPSRRTRFKWLPDYELTVFHSFRDSMKDGLQGESTMRSEAWNRALEAMQRQHGIILLKRQVVSKFDNTKSKYRTWCFLKREPGFNFDERTRRVGAPSDVWDRYLQTHPEAACFRTAPLEHEALLHEIYHRVAFYTPSRPNTSFAIMQVHPQHTPMSASPTVVSTAAAAVAAADSSSSNSRNTDNADSTNHNLSSPTPHDRTNDLDNQSSALSSAISLSSPGGVLNGGESTTTSSYSTSTPWVERAMDIFLEEFKESDLVQLRALRKFDSVPTAMLFCKIGPDVRKTWVQEIRDAVRHEVSGRGQSRVGGSASTAASEMEDIAAAATATMTTSR